MDGVNDQVRAFNKQLDNLQGQPGGNILSSFPRSSPLTPAVVQAAQPREELIMDEKALRAEKQQFDLDHDQLTQERQQLIDEDRALENEIQDLNSKIEDLIAATEGTSSLDKTVWTDGTTTYTFSGEGTSGTVQYVRLSRYETDRKEGTWTLSGNRISVRLGASGRPETSGYVRPKQVTIIIESPTLLSINGASFSGSTIHSEPPPNAEHANQKLENAQNARADLARRKSERKSHVETYRQKKANYDQRSRSYGERIQKHRTNIERIRDVAYKAPVRPHHGSANVRGDGR